MNYKWFKISYIATECTTGIRTQESKMVMVPNATEARRLIEGLIKARQEQDGRYDKRKTYQMFIEAKPNWNQRSGKSECKIIKPAPNKAGRCQSIW